MRRACTGLTPWNFSHFEDLEGRDNTLRAVAGKCHEYQNVGPVHVLKVFSADNLEIRGMDEAALIEKFRKLLARDSK